MKVIYTRRALRRAPAEPPLRSLPFILPLPVVDFLAGGLGGAVTPVPFPNTDVKGPRGDGTTPRSVGEQRAAGLLIQAPSLSQRLGAFFVAARGAGPVRLYVALSMLSSFTE